MRRGEYYDIIINADRNIPNSKYIVMIQTDIPQVSNIYRWLNLRQKITHLKLNSIHPTLISFEYKWIFNMIFTVNHSSYCLYCPTNTMSRQKIVRVSINIHLFCSFLNLWCYFVKGNPLHSPIERCKRLHLILTVTGRKCKINKLWTYRLFSYRWFCIVYSSV